MHTTPDGRFYTVDGLALSSPGRPIQPKTSIVLDLVPDMVPHGALLLAGKSTAETDFDPVIARPVPTSTVSLGEPDFEVPGWSPPKMFVINRGPHGTWESDPDRLVVVPAQFRGDQDEGLERRFTELDFAITYSDSLDFTPPAIWNVESLLYAGTTTFQVSADDASGIERVLITYSADGDTWQSIDLTYRAYTERWEGSLSGLTEGAIFLAQVMDTAGNVTVSENKGQYFAPQQIAIYLPIVQRGGPAR